MGPSFKMTGVLIGEEETPEQRSCEDAGEDGCCLQVEEAGLGEIDPASTLTLEFSLPEL